MKRFLLFVSTVLLLLLAIIPCSAAELTETENNNTLAKANEFASGDSITARLSNEKDVDCFKLYVPFDGTINFTFTPHDQDSSVYSYSWTLTVYAPDMTTKLLSGSLSGRKTTIFKVENVKEGVHYLEFKRVSGGNPLTNGYSKQSFSISAQVSCNMHGTLNDWEITKEATCKNEGERVQRCSVCNTIVVTEPIAKLDHAYTDWTILEEATITKDGERKRTCVQCAEVFTENYTHPMAIVLAVGVVGGIGLVIIVISVIRKKSQKQHSYSSSSNRSSYSGGSSSSSNYGSLDYSGDSYSYGGSSSYETTTSYDDGPIDYGYIYDYNPANNTYTNGDGVTQTLDSGYVIGDDGSVHLDVSDM